MPTTLQLSHIHALVKGQRANSGKTFGNLSDRLIRINPRGVAVAPRDPQGIVAQGNDLGRLNIGLEIFRPKKFLAGQFIHTKRAPATQA